MKVTFEIDLESEGGNDDFKSISRHREMASFIYDFEQELRKIWKYEGECERAWTLWHDTKREFELADL